MENISNIKIKVNSPEESIKIQEYAFGLGWGWVSGGKKIRYIDEDKSNKLIYPFLYFNDKGNITTSPSKDLGYFIGNINREVAIKDIFY